MEESNMSSTERKTAARLTTALDHQESNFRTAKKA
jgi:hypothetical protein